MISYTDQMLDSQSTTDRQSAESRDSQQFIEDILADAGHLPRKQREDLADVFDALQGLPPREPEYTDFQRMVVSEYANYCDPKLTAKALNAPVAKIRQALREEHVAEAVIDKMIERMDRSELDADYVRNYIHTLLELCPTDYFSKLPNGLWCINPDDFRKVPKEIRRLVESVELKLDKRSGDIVLNVKFISKSQALSLAAKYTMIEKHAHLHAEAPPWAEIAGAVKVDEKDELEQLIQEAGQPAS
jgi:hypothetical protein